MPRRRAVLLLRKHFRPVATRLARPFRTSGSYGVVCCAGHIRMRRLNRVTILRVLLQCPMKNVRRRAAKRLYTNLFGNAPKLQFLALPNLADQHRCDVGVIWKSSVTENVD